MSLLGPEPERWGDGKGPLAHENGSSSTNVGTETPAHF